MNAMHHGKDTVVVVMDAESARRICEFLLKAETPYRDVANLKTTLALQLDAAARNGAKWERNRIAAKYSS